MHMLYSAILSWGQQVGNVVHGPVRCYHTVPAIQYPEPWTLIRVTVHHTF